MTDADYIKMLEDFLEFVNWKVMREGADGKPEIVYHDPEMAPPSDKEIEGMKLAGQYHGYPACCIDWFVNRLFSDLNSRGEFNSLEQRQAGQRSGFIPCPECAAKVAAGAALESLLVDRVAPWPLFPIHFPSAIEDYDGEIIYDPETERRNKLQEDWISEQLSQK